MTCTEVALNPDEVAAALADPTVFPTPLAGTEGPSWIQIGTEGGFLPAPAVIPAQPTTWVNDPTVFNAGNVDLHSLLVGPAERADVIVDFSAFAGQTLILYNDAPAAFPARDPRYDYYTGNGDYRDTGGAPSTLAGYGPNTRTVMQIKVAAAAQPPTAAFNLPALETAFHTRRMAPACLNLHSTRSSSGKALTTQPTAPRSRIMDRWPDWCRSSTLHSPSRPCLGAIQLDHARSSPSKFRMKWARHLTRNTAA